MAFEFLNDRFSANCLRIRRRNGFQLTCNARFSRPSERIESAAHREICRQPRTIDVGHTSAVPCTVRDEATGDRYRRCVNRSTWLTADQTNPNLRSLVGSDGRVGRAGPVNAAARVSKSAHAVRVVRVAHTASRVDPNELAADDGCRSAPNEANFAATSFCETKPSTSTCRRCLSCACRTTVQQTS